MDYYLGISNRILRKMQMLDIWLVKFQRKSKTLSEPFEWYFKSIICRIEILLCFTGAINIGWLGLKIQLWLIIGQCHWRGIFWMYFCGAITQKLWTSVEWVQKYTSSCEWNLTNNVHESPIWDWFWKHESVQENSRGWEWKRLGVAAGEGAAWAAWKSSRLKYSWSEMEEWYHESQEMVLVKVQLQL